MDKPYLELIHSDALHELKAMPSESFDLIFADPPYFLSRGGFSVSSGRQVPVTKGLWDEPGSGDGMEPADFHMAWITESKRLLKPNGSIVISGTYHSIVDYGVALKENSFKILNDIIWFKPNGAPNLSRRRLTASHETLIWAAKGDTTKHTFNYDQMRESQFDGDKIKRPGRQLRSVWWIPSTPRSQKKLGAHPTQKPLSLLERVVLAFTNPGDTVLDPFMGSGTTGVVCAKLDRSFVGIEREYEYFELAKRRMGVD